MDTVVYSLFQLQRYPGRMQQDVRRREGRTKLGRKESMHRDDDRGTRLEETSSVRCPTLKDSQAQTTTQQSSA